MSEDIFNLLISINQQKRKNLQKLMVHQVLEKLHNYQKSKDNILNIKNLKHNYLLILNQLPIYKLKYQVEHHLLIIKDHLLIIKVNLNFQLLYKIQLLYKKRNLLIKLIKINTNLKKNYPLHNPKSNLILYQLLKKNNKNNNP